MSTPSSGTGQGLDCFPLVEELAKRLDPERLDTAVKEARTLLEAAYNHVLSQVAPVETMHASPPLPTTLHKSPDVHTRTDLTDTAPDHLAADAVREPALGVESGGLRTTVRLNHGAGHTKDSTPALAQSATSPRLFLDAPKSLTEETKKARESSPPATADAGHRAGNGRPSENQGERIAEGSVYPAVDATMRANWAGEVAQAKRHLNSLSRARREWVEREVGKIMNARHQAPPIIRADVIPGTVAGDYLAWHDDMRTLIAARLDKEPSLDLPLEMRPAYQLSERLRAASNSRATSGGPAGMRNRTGHDPAMREPTSPDSQSAVASSSRHVQGNGSDPSRTESASVTGYGMMGPEFETEWIIENDLWHGDKLAGNGVLTLTAERLSPETPTTLEIVGQPIAFRGEANGVTEEDLFRSLDTVMKALRPHTSVDGMVRRLDSFQSLNHGYAVLSGAQPGREFSLSPQWTVGMHPSELLDFIMNDVKALSVKSADTAHIDAEAGAAFAKAVAAEFYSAVHHTNIAHPWLAWETLDNPEYRSLAGLLLLVFLQAITPAHKEDDKSSGKEGGKWFKSYSFIASRHNPGVLANGLTWRAKSFLNDNSEAILKEFTKYARSTLSGRRSGDPLDASFNFVGATARDYLNNFLKQNPDHFVPQAAMRIATTFAVLDHGKVLVELRNLADVNGVAQAREQYQDLKRRTQARWDAAAWRAGLGSDHHAQQLALQTRLAGDGLAGALDRMLRITSELNVVHHQRALGFEFLKRDAVQPLVRSTLRTSRLIQGGPQGTVEPDRTVVRSVLPKLDTDLSEFAYTVNLLDHDGRSWEQVRKQWTQVMYDSATLREALSGESANWPPREAMENWKEISALPGLRPRTNLKDVDAAVKTALAQPGNTPALQAVLFQATAWRQDNQGSKREFAISELERNVLHRLAGSPEHLARRPPQGWGSREVGQLPQMPLRTHGTRTGTNSQPQNARYPQPASAVLEEWSDPIRYAHEYLQEAHDSSLLRQQAAEIVAKFHVAPPAESGQLSDEARSYWKLYNSTIDVVAFALGRDRGRTQPTLRANEVAQKMAMDFGSSPEAHIALNQNLQSQAGSVPDPVMPEFVEGSRRNTETGGSAGVHDASATRRQRRLGGAREAGLDPQVEGWELGRSITVTAPESWMDSFHPQSHNSDELEPPARVPLSAEATPEIFTPFTRSYAHSTRSYTYQVGSGGTVVLPNGASLTGRWAALGDDFVNEQGYILYRESGWIGHVANWDTLQKILDFDLHGYYLISDSTNLQFIPVTDTQPPVLLPLKEDSAPPRTSSKGTEENTVTGLSADTPAPHVSQETVKTASQREVGLTDTHPAQPEANPQDNDKLTRSAAPPPSYLDGPRPTVDEPGGPEARVSRALAGHSARSAKHPARFTAPDITGLTPADAIRLELPITDTSVTEAINNATQQATRQIQHTIGHPAGWGLTDTDILLTAPTEGLPVWLTIAQGIADTLEHRVKLLIGTETAQPLEICPKSA